MNKLNAFYSRAKLYIANISWIMTERSLSMIVGFFVTILVARNLGPEQFGILEYSVSLVTLFTAAGHMGLSGLVVREIVRHPAENAETLGTSFILKLSGVLVGFFVLVWIAFVSDRSGSVEFWVLLIVSGSVFFRPLDVIDYWFEAHVQAKYPAISRSIALLITAIVKTTLVLTGSGLVFFAFANLLQTAIAALLLFLLYRAKSTVPVKTWTASLRRARDLLGEGWIVFLGSIFGVIYLKIDQIMLKWLAGSQEVGVYAVAARFSEAWYFVPTAIVASFFPRLIKLRESDPALYTERLQQIFDLLFTLALAIAVSVTLVAKPVFSLMFGPAYVNSAPILMVHVWAGLFISMRAAFSKWILIEDAVIFSLITQGFGAFTNVAFNMLLIPSFGGMGAAIATLISYAGASYFSLLLYKKSRPVFWMMSRAICSPLRYPMARLWPNKS